MRPHQVGLLTIQKGGVGPRRHYVGKIGFNVGREDEAVFEAYARALEQTRPEAASAVEKAVDAAIANGIITGDVTKPGQAAASTAQFGDAVVAAITR